MFERFAATFAVDVLSRRTAWLHPRLCSAIGYDALIAAYGGCGFERGLYRLHSAETGPTGQSAAAEAFPHFAGDAVVFAYDWLGRQFALLSNLETTSRVVMLDHATGQSFDIAGDLTAFHNVELVDHPNEALAAQMFTQWCNAQPPGTLLQPGQCVGFAVPLFLGGQDTVENLKLTDLSVDWEFSIQLRRQMAASPDGTKIRNVTIEE